MNTEKLEKLKKSLDNKFIPDNMKDKIRAEIKKLEADIKTDETITATEVKEEVKEIEKKVEKALEVAEEKEEEAEAKKEEAQEKAEAKAEEKKAKKSKTKTPKTDEKPKSAKKSVFSVAKEIRKDGETWEEAKDRARKMMKSETTETKKKTKTETQKLLAMVRRNKEYKKLTGSSNLAKDAQRRALPRGKRVSQGGWKNQYGESEGGKVYYENRANRVDVGGFKNAYLENGGGVDGIIELKPLALIPLSTQLNRLSGYGWTYGDWESEDGGKPSTMPNSVIVNVHTKQKFRLSPFYIYEGYDHYNSKPLYRVEDASEEGEYVGEWYTKREDAEQELKEMFGSYAGKGVYVETLDEEIDLTDDGKPRVVKTQEGGNKSFSQRREMHGASPEALAFDNGGKVGRYSILGEVDGEQPVLYATTDDKERIKPLVNMAEIDLYELTGKNHRIFVTDEVTDDEVYSYGNGGRTRERRYVNHSEDYEVRYSKDKPHRRGYGYAGGGVVLDNVKIEVYKSFHGLKAENYFDDVNGYDWNVVTMKRHTGELVSSARGGKANKSEGNVEFFTFDYNSPNIKLISSRPSRVTEKVIEIQHSQALQLFKEKMEQGNFAEGGTIIGTPETPLGRDLGIDYTGLVGETGGMSAGEMFAEGGSIENQYEGKTPSQIWSMLSVSQKYHFLEDHSKEIESTPMSIEKATKTAYKFLPTKIKKSFEHHVEMGQYAMGGSLGNHGLKQGDQIIKTMSGGVQKVKTKSGDIVYVNLANGYRGTEPPLPFAKGGYTNERRHVNKAQDYEVRYAKNKPNRTGYLGKRSFDDGGISNGRYEVVKVIGFDKNGKTLPKNEIKVIADFDSRKEALNFVYEQQFKKDVTQRDIFIRDTKTNKTFAEGGFMTDPNFGDFQNQVYATGGGVDDVKRFDVDFYKSFSDKDTSEEKILRSDSFEDIIENAIKIAKKENYSYIEIYHKGLFIGSMKEKDGYDFKKGRYYENNPLKYATGGGVEKRSLKSVIHLVDWKGEGIKKWYLRSYPKDEMGEELDDTVTFKDLWDALNEKKDVYEIIGVGDSLIRERLFEYLALLYNVDYDVVYNKWLESDDYETGGVTKNYINRNQLNTITIKKGDKKLTYKVSDVYNGAYKLEEGGNLEKTAFYVSKRNIVKVQLKDGRDVKVANGYWIKKGAKPIHTSKYDDGGEVEYKGGGKTTFKEKATAIAKKFEGKKVEPKYQKEYGKTYDKTEAKEVGNKIAGSQKAKYDSKMSKGGSTKRGGAMQLAKEIRKDGESWQSALKRANEQMRNK